MTQTLTHTRRTSRKALATQESLLRQQARAIRLANTEIERLKQRMAQLEAIQLAAAPSPLAGLRPRSLPPGKTALDVVQQPWPDTRLEPEPAAPGIVTEPDFPMPRTLADLAASRRAFLASVPQDFVEEDGLPPVLLSEG